MQQTVNTADIDIFACNVSVDILNRVFAFDFSNTVFKNSPAGFGVALAVSVVDQAGVALAEIDWNSPQIPNASITTQYELDLSMQVDWRFLFQKYKIIVAAKDIGQIVYLEFPIKEVCQPKSFTDAGYAEGSYYLKMDCTNNNITVRDTTVMVYQGNEPSSTVTDGTLYFPIGTKEPINFTFTPFSDSNIYTGNYRLDSTTTATYNLGDGFFVLVAYSTVFNQDFTCEKAMESLVCCLVDYQTKMQANCGNAIGVDMQQRWDAASVPLITGLIKENAGDDASVEAVEVKRILRCNCGKSQIKKVQSINPNIPNINVTQAGGVTVISSQAGVTKTFQVSSSIYSISKKVPSDTAFAIYPAVTTGYSVQYPIGFNYDIMAATIYTATANNSTLLTQLNSLIFASGIDLSNVDGKCVIDLSSTDFFLTQRFATASTYITSITIGVNTYTAPSGTIVSNTAAVEAWLNGLGYGTFSASYSNGVAGFYANILSTANSNDLVSVLFSSVGRDIYTTLTPFQRTNVSLVALLQALIDYLCDLSATQVQLGQSLSLCSLNSTNQVVTTVYPSTTLLSAYQTAEAAVICDFANRIKTLTAATCDTIKSLFQTSINVLQQTDIILGTKGGVCAGINPIELGTRIIELGVYDSGWLAAFCNAVQLCQTGSICTLYSQFQAATAEQSPSTNLFDLIVSFINSGATTNDISYARIDNTAPPYSYLTIPNIAGGLSPYQIPVPVDKGQYSIGIKPNYPDGRVCPTIYITTPACGSIITFGGAINLVSTDYYFDATYSATSPMVGVTVTYPNGGTANYSYNSGDSISILLPAGMFGNYSFTMFPICNDTTGWVGASTAPVVIPLVEPTGRVSVIVEGGFSDGTIYLISGVSGYSLAAPITDGDSVAGFHTAFSNPICVSVAGALTGIALGCDIYIAGIFSQRIDITTATPATYCSSSPVTILATQALSLRFNSEA